MSEAKTIFSLDGIDSTIQCTKEEKLKDICLKYATKLDKKLNTLLFLYERKQIDLDLNFIQLANQDDKIRNEMKISVYKTELIGSVSPSYDKEKINEILLSNNYMRNSLNEMNLIIENIAKNTTTNSINDNLENISIKLNIMNVKLKANNETLKNISTNDKSEIKKKDEIKIKNKISFKNIKDIKADYFVQKIFSFLDEKVKLKLLIYNKSLQKKADINLTNYKLFSGKYIVYESNGKVKEYSSSNDYLLFYGEYLIGKRNGLGKEYENNIDIIFEGEYLNGIRDGKGKEYHKNGRLKFEGEYLNGQRSGKGKEYNNYDGSLIFEGEYLNGERLTGKGYDNKGNLIYDSKTSNALIKEYSQAGTLIFEGEYLNGQRAEKEKNIIKMEN